MGQRAEHLDGRRLPRSVRTKERENLSLAHREVDAVDGSQLAVALGQAANVDRNGARGLLCEFGAT